MLVHATGQGPTIFQHIGTVENVIAAHLPPEVTSKRVSAADFYMGFELATPKELSSLGEAVLINGLCYTTSTDSHAKDYNKTINGSEFIPGGIFLIPKGAKPSHRVEINEKMPLLDFYNSLYRQVGQPLAFAGIFYFTKFHGTAIGKPPINGHNIFTHKQEYYPNPETRVENVYAFVIGALTDFKGHPTVNEELKTVLYKNPMDAGSELTQHAHTLLLKKRVTHITEILPNLVDQTLHLFAEGTELVSGSVEIFTAAGVKKYREI